LNTKSKFSCLLRLVISLIFFHNTALYTKDKKTAGKTNSIVLTPLLGVFTSNATDLIYTTWCIAEIMAITD